MPLQNRVTPFGDVVAIPKRGLFTGNRGIIHDPTTKTLLRQRWTSGAWLICNCEYKGNRRDVMSRRSWTELFFLDEAVALAAGHRPCFLCRREAATEFRSYWSKGNWVKIGSAREIDHRLHRERLEFGRKKLHPLKGSLRALPAGAVVSDGKQAFTIVDGRAFRWTEEGYSPSVEMHNANWLLTPPSTLMALKAGYKPVLHPTLG
jgi:hypothetical protein